jgi:hypothetical protein
MTPQNDLTEPCGFGLLEVPATRAGPKVLDSAADTFIYEPRRYRGTSTKGVLVPLPVAIILTLFAAAAAAFAWTGVRGLLGHYSPERLAREPEPIPELEAGATPVFKSSPAESHQGATTA